VTPVASAYERARGGEAGWKPEDECGEDARAKERTRRGSAEPGDARERRAEGGQSERQRIPV
jgi:hypothetical protein